MAINYNNHKARHILILDDDKDYTAFVKRSIKQDTNYDYTFTCLSSLNDILDACKEKTADILILDYQIPKTDGLEILKTLKNKHNCKMPVIVLTADGDESIAVEFMKNGAVDYISKSSLVPKVLLHSIDHNIKVTQLNNELSNDDVLNFNESALHFAMDKIASGIFILDNDLEVIFANAFTENLLNGSDALKMNGNHMHFGDEKTVEIKNRINGSNGKENDSYVFKLHNGNGRNGNGKNSIHSCVIFLSKLIGVNGNNNHVLFISDPALNKEIPAKYLKIYFDLTKRESEIINLLLSGNKLETVAINLKVSTNTIKTHFRSIYQKTGVNKQSDLIKLILSTPGWTSTHDDGL